MIRIKYVLPAIGFICFLFACKQPKSPEKKQAELPIAEHYVSIDGLWRCTPETANQLRHGTLEYLIQINGDGFDKITAKGCLLWDNLFYDYWKFDNVEFIDSANQLVLVDNEGGTYKGFVDKTKGIINGVAYWGDEDDTSKIDFVRDEVTDVKKLFIPYPVTPNGSIKYAYHQPEKGNDLLQTASIFNDVKDSTAFFSLMERIIRQEFGRIESFLIIKDQNLILEEYFYGFDKTQLHKINSCTKSITSLLLGISLDRHKNFNIDSPVFDFFPQFDSLRTPEKDKITLKHVLTMTAGFSADDDFEIHSSNELVKQILSWPLESIPGEEFKYNNNNTNLLGSIIYSLENKQADEFAKEVLFKRLGITDFYWEKENGVLQCHNGLQLYPKDMAKIGLLVVNNGLWEGEQIVPKEWIDNSTKPQVPESDFFDYGYQWWCRSQQKVPWWNNPVHGGKTEHDLALAMGYGGQFIMLVKDLNMVIVTTSSDNNESNGKWLTKVPMVIEELVPLFD